MNINHTRRLTVLLTLALVMTVGCNDDEECVNCPGPPAPFERLWPNADSTSWTYELEAATYPGPDAGDDELPDMNTLYAALQRDVPGERQLQDSGWYGLTFRGMITTASGVTAQHLEESFVSLPAYDRQFSCGSMRLLQTVARARPDLRRVLAVQYGVQVPEPGAKSPPDRFYDPLLLGGYAWEKNDAGIYGYGDVSTHHSWVYIEEDMSPGSRFRMQLVPELADDIFLYGQVWRTFTATVGGTAYRQSAEVFYVVDLGIVDLTDENGNAISNGRSYVYGVVHYVPGVGPVFDHERSVFAGGNTAYQEPFPSLIIDCRAELFETVLPD